MAEGRVMQEDEEVLYRALVEHTIRLAGDPHPLVEAIGLRVQAQTDRLVTPTVPPVYDLPSLARFLDWYREEVLLPIEAPAIIEAAEHLRRHEPRELIAQDRRLGEKAVLHPFAEASKTVGRSQLRRLLPMRDQKIIRQYWQAVEFGQAHGWHMIVFGLIVGLFYIPYRQGLFAYARRTQYHFLQAAQDRLALPSEAVQELEQTVQEKTFRALNELTGKTELRVIRPHLSQRKRSGPPEER